MKKDEIGTCTLKTVEDEIREKHNKFIKDITAIANKCEEPIEMSLFIANNDPLFVRNGSRHPFGIKISPSKTEDLRWYTVFGNPSIKIIRQTAEEYENTCI